MARFLEIIFFFNVLNMKSVMDKYPMAKSDFFHWRMERYGVSDNDHPCFYDAPEYEQHRAVARFFGYPVMHQEFTDQEILMRESEKYVREYHEIMIKYSGHVPDPIKEMKGMPFREIVKKHPHMFSKSENLQYGLCHALVPIDKSYNLKMPVLKSLKDALVDLVAEIKAIEIPQEPEKINITKIEEDAPF